MAASSVTLPPKNRQEWQQMISGEINYRYSNFVLQMQLTQVQKDIKNKKITMEEAIDRIYELCSKYVLAVQTDFKQIFKTW